MDFCRSAGRKKIAPKFIVAAIVWALFDVGSCPAAVLPESHKAISLDAADRILILAPHPDDEILGCAGIIQQAQKKNIPVQIVYFTYGDNNQWAFFVYRKHPVVFPTAVRNMGIVRHDEALAAAKVLGIPPSQLIFLGYPDFRTLDIWYSHWGKRQPEKSMLTNVRAVPYENAYRPGAPYKGEEILKDLRTIFQDFKPTKIFLSHPADHNADHRALYLFTRVALWDLGAQVKAAVYPYLIHYKNWPLPRGSFLDKSIAPPALFAKSIPWQTCLLGPDEARKKLSAVKQHASQYNSSAKYMLSFVRKNELFGELPIINFNSQLQGALLSTDRSDSSAEVPEEFIHEERASFVGIEKRSIILLDDNLIISVKLSRPIGKTVGTAIYIFGYRDDVPFGEMPKVRIKFGSLRHSIRDQSIKIPFDSITVQRRAKEITIRVPLKILGNPQRILTSANTYMGAVPLDWISWRIVELSEAPAPQR